MPILWDEGGAVRRLYEMQMAFNTGAYPQEWLIGVDGTVVYFNNRLEHEALSAAIETELAAQAQGR